MRRLALSISLAVLLISAAGADQVPWGTDHPRDFAESSIQPGETVRTDVAGQPFFEPLPPVFAGFAPRSLAIADFDLDGNADVVTVNRVSDDAAVLLGNGDGTFKAPIRLPVGNAPATVAVGDFDRDGKPDLVIASFVTDLVTIYPGNGDGSFEAGPEYGIDAANALLVNDFNDDGLEDVIVGSFETTTLLGNGDGTFEPRFGVLSDASGYSAGDLNNDGRLDLGVAGGFASGLVETPLGLGDGTFRTPPRVYVFLIFPLAIELADFDEDGKLDAAIAAIGDPPSGNPGGVTVAFGDGLGDFLPGEKHVLLGQRLADLAVTDFDRDGNQDIVTVDFTRNTLELLFGDGSGEFFGNETFTTGERPVSVAIGDLNGDSRADVVTANERSGDISVFLSRGQPIRFVEIDVKPGGLSNPVNPRARGVIPVAILGSESFEVSELNLTTLRFGPGGAPPAHNLADPITLADHLQDVDLDGHVDLVTHYWARATGILCGAESATLFGETLEGQPIEGTDAITTVPCRTPPRLGVRTPENERTVESSPGAPSRPQRR